MTSGTVGGLLAVDFITAGYRISAHVNTRAKSVSDMLNDRLRSYLPLDDVYISRISNPGDIVAAYPRAQLRKDDLLFAIVPIKESISKNTTSGSYFGKQRLRAWLAMPTFEVEGEIQVAGAQFDLDSYLTKNTADYFPVLEATARATSWPDITYSGKAFLVNKSCIDLFCVNESET